MLFKVCLVFVWIMSGTSLFLILDAAKRFSHSKPIKELDVLGVTFTPERCSKVLVVLFLIAAGLAGYDLSRNLGGPLWIVIDLAIILLLLSGLGVYLFWRTMALSSNEAPPKHHIDVGRGFGEDE